MSVLSSVAWSEVRPNLRCIPERTSDQATLESISGQCPSNSKFARSKQPTVANVEFGTLAAYDHRRCTSERPIHALRAVSAAPPAELARIQRRRTGFRQRTEDG